VCGTQKGAFCRRMNDLRKTQESFARKAQAQPEHRFGDLYHLVCREEWLREALRANSQIHFPSLIHPSLGSGMDVPLQRRPNGLNCAWRC
jgi:hypothetical protein